MYQISIAQYGRGLAVMSNATHSALHLNRTRRSSVFYIILLVLLSLCMPHVSFAEELEYTMDYKTAYGDALQVEKWAVEVDQENPPDPDTSSQDTTALKASNSLNAKESGSVSFNKWTPITLPADSNAACGNGSPYTFFILLQTPRVNNVTVLFEGGGACSTKEGCEKNSPEGWGDATHPDGVTDHYLKSTKGFVPLLAFRQFIRGGSAFADNPRLTGLIAITKETGAKLLTQGDNLVLLPYCTGDLHAGMSVREFPGRKQHFVGHINAIEALNKAKAILGEVSRLTVTGYSAGGAGATINYPFVREIMNPKGQSRLIADSGPLFPEPLGAKPDRDVMFDIAPSAPSVRHLVRVWDLTGKSLPNTAEPHTTYGSILAKLRTRLPEFTSTNLGSIYGALAKRYGDDTFAYLAFQKDMYFAASLYDGLLKPPLKAANGVVAEDVALRRRNRLSNWWTTGMKKWVAELDKEYCNVHYYIPYYRPYMLSHVVTAVDFSGTGIQDRGEKHVGEFLNRVLKATPFKGCTETGMRYYENAELAKDKVEKLSQLVKVARTAEKHFKEGGLPRYYGLGEDWELLKH